ncbi:hypothetical protein LCGC14_2787960 [marine sediment metagenome]|uniref:Uncharacterized protein n=1 Tax=marine sediment metagenome TaxID=412755 RepID=A0A0F9BHX1_9ZZZZ
MKEQGNCEEHLRIGTIRGELACLDCGAGVMLERGIPASNWYVTSRAEYLERKKARDEGR